MREISEERLKRFWEWCGLTYKTSRSTEYWYGPKGESIVSALGNGGRVLFTLGNLVKYAVPKCQLRGEIVSLIALEHSGFECCIAYFVEPEPRIEVRDGDPAIAVFLAIEKLIEEVQ